MLSKFLVCGLHRVVVVAAVNKAPINPRVSRKLVFLGRMRLLSLFVVPSSRGRRDAY